MTNVIVFGGSGYSGLELLKHLSRHPSVEVAHASSDRWAGQKLNLYVPELSTNLSFVTHETALAKAKKGQIAFLATPNEVSLDLAPKLLKQGLRVIDLSGAFRLEKTGDYSKWYGFKHNKKALLDEAHYGLFELFPYRSEELPRLVANPGCYATAAILALGPILGAGLVDLALPVVIDGKSGVTGAGRKLDEAYLFNEVQDSIRPYRIRDHQHTPEIERALSRFGRTKVTVSFTPHLIPIRRGLLISAYAKAKEDVKQRTIDQAYEAAYSHAKFVRVMTSSIPVPLRVLNTNFCDVSAKLDPRTGLIMAFGALDNLVKGAAGQAIQNLNSLLGLPVETGLLGSGREEPEQ